MKQKIIFGSLGIIVLIALVFFLFSQKKSVSPIVSNDLKSNETVVPSPAAGSKSYTDPAGFKFNYPKDLDVAAKKMTDDSVYSDLEIKSKDSTGGATIKAVDSNLIKIDDYFKDKKISSFSGGISKLKLADIDARQYQVNSQIITVALDQGVLFTITVDLPVEKKDYWQKANNTLISSFAFVAPQNTTSTDTNSSSEGEDDVIFEGEEVIQ